MKRVSAKVVNTTSKRRMPTRRMAQLAGLIISGERRSGTVNIILIGDARMKTLNRKYRGQDRTTDVLSFHLDDDDGDQPPPLIGEIYISVPQAEKRARSLGHDLPDEILFLTAHGLLHILGHKHESMKKFQVMIERQLHYLNKLYGKP